MSLLTTLHPNATAAVIGASGGIGGALVNRLAAEPGIERVLALARRRSKTANSDSKIQTATIDVTDEAAVRAAARAVGDNPLDLVIVATGILHRGDDIRPEKSMKELRADRMLEVFALNAVAPAIVAKHFLPLLRRGHKTVFAALSARVGSISDNRLGGWASYRASKAALNMLLRTLAIEQARRWPDTAVVGLHPGTVDTALSQPFTRSLPSGQLTPPDSAAENLLRVIEGLTPAASGGFFAWDGTPIDY